MKTKYPLLFAGLSLLFVITKSNAQATTASNTIVSTNYLGSANNVDVTFKRNNVFAGMLTSNSVSLGIGSFAAPSSVSIGINAGQYSLESEDNVYIGLGAGRGDSNLTNSGNSNTFIGEYSGYSNSTGSDNTFLGSLSGNYNQSGYGNVYIGVAAGEEQTDGNYNTFIGNYSGNSTGSNNVFIGNNAGRSESGSNKLSINNSGSRTNSLIWGDFAASQLKLHGKVGIGGNGTTAFGNFPTTAGGVNVSSYNLFVKGGILTEEVRVSLQSTWADYVFLKDYKLPTLEEVETQIKEKGHLRNVPSAKEIKENGIELGEMSKIQQEKIEELTLYLIQQNKEIQKQEEKIKTLENQAKELEELKALVKVLVEKNKF